MSRTKKRKSHESKANGAGFPVPLKSTNEMEMANEASSKLGGEAKMARRARKAAKKEAGDEREQAIGAVLLDQDYFKGRVLKVE